MSQVAQASPAPHRFTRDEYHHMAAAALFVHERVELLDGVIVTMSPQDSPHSAAVHRLLYGLLRILGSSAYVRVQSPVILNDWSEPEPDIAVCVPDPSDYAHAHPKAHQVHLVVEVADTSLAYDRNQKLAAYAASGIPAYWIVNLNGRQVETFAAPDPAAARYRREGVAREGDSLPVLSLGSTTVSDILPPL